MKPLEVGICSWSLKAPSFAEALQLCKQQLGLNLIQLGFFSESQIADYAGVRSALEVGGIEVSATCVGFPGEDYSSIRRIAETGGYMPDEQWPQRLAMTEKVRDITADLGVKMMTTHIGFVPHEAGAADYAKMRDRVRQVADSLAEKGLVLTMETGQEPVDVLLQFIDDLDRPNVKVNFDPGNVILYGIGDPVEAAAKLAPHIAHVHCKDGKFSSAPGVEFGKEVPLGQGDAKLDQVLPALRSRGYTGPLLIEREAGADRVGDIRTGIEFLKRVMA